MVIVTWNFGYFTQLRTESVNPTAESSPAQSQSKGLKVVPVAAATFKGHHGSINVQLSFPNSCFVYLLRYAPFERTFVTALFHQHTVVEISKID